MFQPNDWVIIWVEGEGDLRGRVKRLYAEMCLNSAEALKQPGSPDIVYEVAVPNGTRFVREQENNIRPLLDPALDDYIRIACHEEPNLSFLTATTTSRGLVSIAYHVYIALEEWAAAKCVKPGAIKAEWQMYQGEKEGNDGK
jgi:hypothetical protein